MILILLTFLPPAMNRLSMLRTIEGYRFPIRRRTESPFAFPVSFASHPKGPETHPLTLSCSLSQQTLNHCGSQPRWFHPDPHTQLLSCSNLFAGHNLRSWLIAAVQEEEGKRLYSRTLRQSALLLVGDPSTTESLDWSLVCSVMLTGSVCVPGDSDTVSTVTYCRMTWKL